MFQKKMGRERPPLKRSTKVPQDVIKTMKKKQKNAAAKKKKIGGSLLHLGKIRERQGKSESSANRLEKKAEKKTYKDKKRETVSPLRKMQKGKAPSP